MLGFRHPAWDTVHARSELLPEDHPFAAGYRDLSITVLVGLTDPMGPTRLNITQCVRDEPLHVARTLDWMVARLDVELMKP